MAASSSSPVTDDDPRFRFQLLGAPIYLGAWALVAAVIPPPRFGREGEVIAAMNAARSSRADLADVSLEPRLIGAAVGSAVLPVSVRVATVDAGAAAHAAGAALVLVPPPLAATAVESGWTAAVVIDDVGQLPAARALARDLAVPLAIDTSAPPPLDALAAESTAIAAGCRVVRTSDVRRTRRVTEVFAALVEARRHA